MNKDLTPKELVTELDKYIIGQDHAKKIVAIAVRNRHRRLLLPEEMRDEIAPKNILLVGPTGVGKTEIARRLAQLVNSPFVKIEATKYTEIGYVGRNVDSMVRDLVEVSIKEVKAEEYKKVQAKAEKNATERILDILYPPREEKEGEENPNSTREKLREKLMAGNLDTKEIELSVDERNIPFLQVFSEAGIEELGLDVGNLMGQTTKKAKKKTSVKEAKKILVTQESEKLMDKDKVINQGIKRAQEAGIIFIDEIDKIVAQGKGQGADVSREGVQRDLLPVVEGTTVITRYGPVRTDYILFIAAGAFSTTKPSDLIPELQGRFPLRAELKGLTREDFVRILQEPKNALLKQYTALLGTEDVKIEFKKDSIETMADMAYDINMSTQDIGARRLHTIVEKVLEDISFQAPDISPCKIPIDAKYVKDKLKGILEDEDLRRYIL